jgi:glycosyltransferase involved in cell wall biosynthesis
MISIVICSVRPDDLLKVTENIARTIGVEHEIIAIDNRVDRRGICEVYNEGTQRAKFDIICFMHEDIEIKTHRWGSIATDIFHHDQKTGIVGVAGGGYKALAPSGWYQLEFHSEERSYQNVLQGYKLNDKLEIHAYHNPRNERLSKVVCVDGLWFCTRRDIALRFPFDSGVLKGFHGYDLDFSLSVFPHFDIVVTYDILMKHDSEGNFNKQWLDEILKLHKKWSFALPQTTSEMTAHDIYMTEKRSFKKLVEQMMEWEYSSWQIQKMLWYSAKTQKMPVRVVFKAFLHFLKLKFNIIPHPNAQKTLPISA